MKNLQLLILLLVSQICFAEDNKYADALAHLPSRSETLIKNNTNQTLMRSTTVNVNGQPLIIFDNRPMDELIAEARTNLLGKGPYDVAITDLKAIIATYPASKAREANELLGYAYEKSKWLDKAIIQYEKYLALYPEKDEDRLRVSQRAMSLEIMVPHEGIHDISKDKKSYKKDGMSLTASVSEYVYLNSDTLGKDLFKWKTNQIDSITGAHFSWKIDHNQYSISTRLRFNTLKDFLDSRANRTNLSMAYTEFSDALLDYYVRAGRQGAVAGAVSRFDGLSTKFSLSPSVRVILASGSPYSGMSTRTNRRFAGAEVDWNMSNNWTLDFYTNRGTADGFLERMAYGTDLEYRNNKQTYLLRTEYDSLYHSINQVTFQGMKYIGNSDIFVILEKRKSPLPFADVALGIGGLSEERQVYNSVSELLAKSGLTGPEIYNYISKTTPDVTNAVVGTTVNLTKDLSLTTNFQMSNLSTVPGFDLSPNFDPIPIQVGQDNIYSFSTHLRKENSFFEYNTTEAVFDNSFGGKKAFFTTLADSYRFGKNKRNVISATIRYDSYDQAFTKTKTVYGILRLLYSVGNGVFETQYARVFVLTPAPESGYTLNSNQNFYLGYRYDF